MPPKGCLKTVGLIILVPILLIGLLVAGLYLDGIITKPVYIQPNSYTGRVVDENTGQPIEGAAVYMYWEIERKLNPLELLMSAEGAPLHYYLGDTVVYTDADGRYRFPPQRIGEWTHWRASRPYGEILIYKKGYVGYSNLSRYDGPDARELNQGQINFQVKDNDVRLRPWKPIYDHRQHFEFLRRASDKKGGERSNEIYDLFVWEAK